LGKANFARKFFFNNIEREKKGLPKIEYSSKESIKVHNEIHYSTINILKELSKHAPVYTIQGNVRIPSIPEVRKRDKKYGVEHIPTRSILDSLPKVSLVKNRLRVLEGLRILFLEYFIDTYWIKEFKPSEYKKKMKEARKETDKAKRVLKRYRKVDILVCHQPPYGILDKVNFPGVPKEWGRKHAGSKVILNYIKKFQPKYVFCGHIHEGEGKKKIGKTQIYNLGVASNVVVDL